jgi:hypothetical protein
MIKTEFNHVGTHAHAEAKRNIMVGKITHLTLRTTFLPQTPMHTAPSCLHILLA